MRDPFINLVRKLPGLFGKKTEEEQVRFLYNIRKLVPSDMAYEIIKPMISEYEGNDGWRRYRDEFLEHFPEALNAMTIPVNFGDGITYSSKKEDLDKFVFLAATHDKVNGIPILELLTDLFSDPDSAIRSDEPRFGELIDKIRKTVGDKLTGSQDQTKIISELETLSCIPAGVQNRADIMGTFLGLEDLEYVSLPDQLRVYDEKSNENNSLEVTTAIYLVRAADYRKSSNRDLRKQIKRPWNHFMTALGNEFGNIAGIMDPNYLTKENGEITSDGELELYRPENGKLVNITKREISRLPKLADLLGRNLGDLKEELDPYLPFMADEVGVLYSDMFLARDTSGIIPFTSIVPRSESPSVAVNDLVLDGERYAVMTARFTRGDQQERFERKLKETYDSGVNMDHWNKFNYLEHSRHLEPAFN